MFYICYLYLFTYTGVQHDFHVKWWSRRLTVTRRVSRVEQKLLTLPKHLCSPLVLSGVRGARSLVVCVVVCKSLFVLLSLFFWPLCCLFFCLLAIVLSVLLSFGHCVVCSSLFTASDYPFGIFWLLCCLFFFIYGFWLPLWYLLAIVLSVLLYLRLLITPLVSSNPST
jgi:hypothetical protein